MLRFLLIYCLCLFILQCEAQTSFSLQKDKSLSLNLSEHDSLPHNCTFTDKQKLNIVLISGSASYVGSLIILYNSWYKDYPQSNFHFFNDNNEWFMLDKYAHAMTSYNMGNLGYHTLLWTGLEEKKAIWYGGFLGSYYLTIIETLDGFYPE